MRLIAIAVVLAILSACGPQLSVVVPPADKEGVEAVRALMVEDTGKAGAKSYVDLLCHVHTEIQRRLQPA